MPHRRARSWLSISREGSGKHAFDAREPVTHDGQEQAVLAREVGIHRTDRVAGAIRDIGERRHAKPLFAKFVGGRVEQAPACERLGFEARQASRIACGDRLHIQIMAHIRFAGC